VTGRDVIHHPMVLRIYLAVFAVVWIAILVGITATLAAHHNLLELVPTILLILFIMLAFRFLRVGVIAGGDELLVRNLYETRRIPRRSIRAFEVNASDRGRLRGRTVQAMLRDGGEVTLDVFTLVYMRQNGLARLERLLDELRGWSRGR
jgi:hypothetical protein